VTRPHDNLIHGGIFAELDERTLARISQRCRWQLFAPGAVLLSDELLPQQVIYIQSGRVKVMVMSDAGREVIIRIAGAGEIVGDYSAIDGQPRNGTVQAVEETVAAGFRAEEFRELLLRYPQLMEAELRALAGSIRTLTDRVTELSTLSVSKRLLVYLLRQAGPAAGAAPPGFLPLGPLPTHAQIAASISTHREAVTKELGRLREEGVLSGEGSRSMINVPLVKLRLGL